MQMCEPAPSWLCFTCFLGCQNHLTVLADLVSSSATHSSLLLQPGCSQLVYSACRDPGNFYWLWYVGQPYLLLHHPCECCFAVHLQPPKTGWLKALKYHKAIRDDFRLQKCSPRLSSNICILFRRTACRYWNIHKSLRYEQCCSNTDCVVKMSTCSCV